MQITVDQKPKAQLAITVELSVEEMKPYLEKAAEELSKQFKIEGFRPGKASLGIVIGKLGAQAVWEHAAEVAVRKTFIQAIREKDIPTIGQPHIHIQKLAPENPFIYQAETAVLPEVTIGDYTKFSTKKKPGVVVPADVDKAIEDLRDMFATEALVDREAKHGDKVEVDIDLFQDHVAIEGGSSKAHPIVIGSGHFIPGFEDQLVGVKKDQEKKFSLPFPKDYHNEKLAGKNGEFAVKVKSVFEVKKPELNDELAKKAGSFTTLSELRTKLEQNLKTEADDKEDTVFERELIEELIKRSKFGELPEMLIESELQKMMNELQEQVERQGGKWEDYLKATKKTVDVLKTEFREQAVRRVQAALLIRTLGKQENIQADPKQIEEELKSTKAMYATNPEILERIDSEDYRDYLRGMNVNKRVVEFLKSKATAST